MSEKTVSNEKKKMKKIFKHPFLDKHTIWGIILLSLLSIVLVQGVIGGIMGTIISIPASMISREASVSTLYTAIVVSSFITLAIYKRWFYPEFEGCLGFVKDPGKWFLIAFAALLAITVPDLIVMLLTHASLKAPTLQTILLPLVAGTSEEVVFRAIPGSYAMRQFNREKDIPVVVLLTSAIFSLVHATNIIAGADVMSTLMQLVSSFGVGILLCALYLRSGSILPSMMLHFLMDVYAMMNADSVSENAVLKAGTTRDHIVNLILSLISVAIALFLLRKSVWKDIMNIWKKKWNQDFI